MKAMKNVFKNQRGMTGLETAIILIAFVTVAAVFGYAVLSAGLFSAEQGKSTIYAGLNEAKSNMELCSSVIATSDDSVRATRIIFSVKNAVAGAPIDMTPCDGTPSATNKTVISLKTDSDYINNIKWTFVPVGAHNDNNLLETGEQFQITVDLTDLGSAGSLSENLTANKTFTLQVKPSIGASITIQRTLLAAITPIMDLDLMTGYGGGSASENISGTGGAGGGTASLTCTDITLLATDTSHLMLIDVYMRNTGTGTADFGVPCGPDVTISVNGRSAVVPYWDINSGVYLVPPGGSLDLQLCLTSFSPVVNLYPGNSFTVSATPGNCSPFSITRTAPNPLIVGIDDVY